VSLRVRRDLGRRPVAVLTSEYGAQVLAPLVASLQRSDVRLVVVHNRFFGGNIGVAGLMVGEDIAATMAGEDPDQRFLLPDACLSEGRFLDGGSVADLPYPVEVVPADGHSLRLALEGDL
jgi:hypothetical protein